MKERLVTCNEEDTDGLERFGSQICEIQRNSARIRTLAGQGHPTFYFLKVIDLGVNRKRICDFILIINSNFGRISNSFQDIDV